MNRTVYSDHAGFGSTCPDATSAIHSLRLEPAFLQHALALTLTLGLAGSPAFAQEESGKLKSGAVAPLPPVRPAHWPLIAPKPVTPQPPAAGEPATATVVYPDKGPSLPAAPRSRMHECGEEWQGMKASGAAANLTWRAFAQACLVR